MSNLKGCIGFSGPKDGGMWLQKLIMFFTSSKWSHSFIVWFPVNGEETVMEAEMAICITPLSKYRDNPNCTYEIYRVSAPENVIDKALMECFHEYAGVRYGFFQLPYFVVKWIYNKLGIPMIHLPDWVREGIICSELQDSYDSRINPYVKSLLSGFDIDLIDPQDIYEIVKQHPEIFTLVESQ